MSTKKALAYAAGITVISGAGLTLIHGLPTLEQAIVDGLTMFVVAFIVMKASPD